MTTLRDLLARLPIDDKLLRALPVPALHGACVLELDLTRGVGESAPDSPLTALRARYRPVLAHVIEGLRHAASDDTVVGLIAHAGGQPIGLPAAGELADAVATFRRSGKPTLAWAETFGELTSGMAGYVFASAFDEIWLQPSGDLGLVGFAAEVPFLRGAFDKAGVEPQFGQRHEYKSAADTYVAHEMTEPHREMLDRLVASFVEQVVDRVAAARGLGADAVVAAIDEAPLLAPRAVELGFVDRLGYRHEAYAALFERLGALGHDTPDLRYVERYRPPGAPSGPSKIAARRQRPVVAVVRVQGAIHLGRSASENPMSGRTCGSDTVGAALRAAGRTDKVAAVVLRIDSPGGSYVASDAIRAEVKALRERGTPVVASMASVAASGGYFAAMGCDEIVSNATTLTGSIGVLAGKLTTEGALNRLGVHRELITWGRNAGMMSGRRPFDEEEWRRLNAWLDDVYADFTSKAAHDRGMPLTDLEPHARGRVWTGADAHERGLVDTLGGLAVAVERACAAADLDRGDVKVRELPKLGPFDRLTPADNSDAAVAASLGDGTALFDGFLAALGLTARGVLTMPEFTIR